MVDAAKSADSCERPPLFPVPPGDAGIAFDLMMRIGADVEPDVELKSRGGFVEALVSEQRLTYGSRPIVTRILWIQREAVFNESALRVLLTQGGCHRDQHQKQRYNPMVHDTRRRACNVKSASFIGKLYCSFSSLRTVRLWRLTSAISIVCAVQNPWTL